MEINDQNLTLLSETLKQTLNPATAKQAEKTLQSVETQPNYPILVLRLVANDAVDPSVRVAAALLFKNFVKRNWKSAYDEDEANRIADSDRLAIKSQIVDLMIALPANLKAQISEAVSIIADCDFPQRWTELLPLLISKISPTDHGANNGVLQTAHSIFKRWRGEFRTNELFLEIRFVLEQFAEPFLNIMKQTDALIQANASNATVLPQVAQTLLHLVKIFYDLNCQDIPEYFEDHMEEFMAILYRYLTYKNPILESEDEEDAGILEKIKAGICEIVEMYVTRYEDVFPMLPQFFETTWTLLTTTGLEPKYDILVSKAISVLSAVVKYDKHRNLFSSEETMRQICEKVILPNMQLRTSDEELFEDDPIEYIRRDLEGSDTDTRRRAATDLVRGIMVQFESQITAIISQYINHYLQQFNSNPSANWKDKDTAIYLLTSIAAKGYAQQHGATATSNLVNVVEFFSNHVAQDLQAPLNQGHPVLKVDAIKYLHTFRNQLTKEQLVSIFPMLVEHLSSDNFVVHTYAAITIERILFLKRDRVFVFTQADIKPYTETLLIKLFALIERGTTPEKLAENEHLMKTVMRVAITSRADMAPYGQIIMGKLTTILGEVCKNPSNPRFNHYLFEAIAALVRFVCPAQPEMLQQFEAMLFPPFEMIMQQDIQEFQPYEFQILSQLLECHRDLPPSYQSLAGPLMQPFLWEFQGNVPALSRFLQEFLSKGAAFLVANQQLEPLLGLFNKLIASRINDSYGFELLCAIYQHVPMNALSPYLRKIFILMLERLQRSKTEKLVRGYVHFTCFAMALNKEGGGPETVLQVYESIQPKMFADLVRNIIITDTTKLQKDVDRKVCAVGLTRLLTESPTMLTQPYLGIWPNTLAAVVKLLEASPEIPRDDVEDDLFRLDLEESGVQVNFSRLQVTTRDKADPLREVTEPRAMLARGLGALNQRSPGVVAPAMATLPPEVQAHVQGYLTAAGVTL
ncbi:uncharacterized protein VTP21DRAFT_35 [Calcarisporiella thermophila]|uniref:uncharacterized protein n=1 Tax=Calcarisporiella thermophila TaxID=911321 RepID=UPI003743C8E7